MKTRWKILLAVMALAVIAIIVLLLPNGSYRRDLEAYKKDLQAKGEKITYAELAPPRSGKMSPSATMFMALPNLVPWTNAPLRFARGYTNLTATEREDYNRNLQKVALLRAAINAGPFDFDLDYPNGPEVRLPELGRLKAATVVAAGTTAQALSQKDYAEAWTDLLAAVDLIRLHEGEPFMICDRVRVANLNIAYPVTVDALQEGVWTGVQLAELQARWDGMNLFTNAERALTMEFATTTYLLDEVRSDFVKLWNYSQAGTAPIFHPPTGRISREVYVIRQRVQTHGWRHSWSYDEELCYLRFAFATKEAAQKITKTGAFVPAFEELSVKFTNIIKSHSNARSHFLVYKAGDEATFSGYLTRLADGEVQRRLVVTAIALERYRLARGSYPARLEELIPEYLKVIPMDLMDGKSLRYRRLPDGDYLLYSVGLDGKDDGGTNDRIWPRPSLAK